MSWTVGKQSKPPVERTCWRDRGLRRLEWPGGLTGKALGAVLGRLSYTSWASGVMAFLPPIPPPFPKSASRATLVFTMRLVAAGCGLRVV